MSRPVIGLLLLCWTGSMLVLTGRPWFCRASLHSRVQPYRPLRGTISSTQGAGPTVRDLVEGQLSHLGEWLAGALGVGEDLATRLDRIHAPFDATAFRVRQVTWALAALGLGAGVAQAIHPPPAITVLLLAGAPALAFLTLEHQIASASARWQRRLFQELPVVGEQVGMLLGAGYSLGASLNRVADRGQGACATDLARVCTRMRQGVGERAALEEWAGLADVDAVDRLVHVLTMNNEATDLGALVSEEARAARAEAQRDTLEILDRRTQQVWIPVTVATLVPGVLLLAVPFIEAMRLFTTG